MNRGTIFLKSVISNYHIHMMYKICFKKILRTTYIIESLAAIASPSELNRRSCD